MRRGDQDTLDDCTWFRHTRACNFCRSCAGTMVGSATLPVTRLGCAVRLCLAFGLLWRPCMVEAGCPNECSKHGYCDKNNTCHCAVTHTGPDCSLRTCPDGIAWTDYASATDVAHGRRECSNRGICNSATGMCKCQKGWTGRSCERLDCPVNDNGIHCSGNGRCLSMRRAAELQDDKGLFVTTTYSLWDADKIWGCICDPGYTGYDCSVRQCPFGDDPLSQGQVNEIQTINCQCSGTCSGSFKISFRGEITAAIPHGSSAADLTTALQALHTIRNVTVTLSTGSTVCAASSVASSVTFTHDAGNLPAMVPYSLLSSAGGSVVLTVGTTTEGTRDWQECSNRGLCDRDKGTCDCKHTWSSSNGAMHGAGLAVGERGDCSYNSLGLSLLSNTCNMEGTAAAGTICGGHGTCNGNGTSNYYYQCLCNSGYTGADCTLMTCPFGTPLFQEASGTDTARGTTEECSGRGLCDRTTGVCECQTGFAGSACQNMDCPLSGTAHCSGQGTCKTMAQLAALASSEGVALGYTYGSNNLANTWDHDKLYGCHCTTNFYFGPLGGDVSEFIGYDCGQRMCPHGDDPLTEGDQQEVQAITCTHTSGTFTLTFRGQTTGAISYNAVKDVASESGSSPGTGVGESLEAKLEALTTIKSLYTVGVDVSYETGKTSLCSTGNIARVTFRQALGDLPLMTVTSSLAGGAIALYEEKKSNQDNLECSGRGLCDRGTGNCQCFRGFASSDGKGNGGPRGDCGYYTAFQDDALYPATTSRL